MIEIKINKIMRKKIHKTMNKKMNKKKVEYEKKE